MQQLIKNSLNGTREYTGKDVYTKPTLKDKNEDKINL
jgi:hypothetical protein